MGTGGSWNGRRIVITGIFALTIVYGLHELLTGGDARHQVPVPSVQSQELVEKGLPGTPDAEVAVPGDTGLDLSKPREPEKDVLDEARWWSEKTWDRVDPFSGPRWTEAPAVSAGEPISPDADPVLRATSYSASGWQAVVGERILRVGDTFMGGRVVHISRDKVVVRGASWDKELRFPEE